MNTNPDAIKILCYGDSNTWGQRPDQNGRYQANERWTGRLQALLGDDYYVVEEGLSSRTTDLEYDRKPGRNGKTYLVPCLVSHTPVDIVAIMLGTNDLKLEFNRNAAQVAQALAGLVADVQTNAQDRNGETPKTILLSPIRIDDTAPDFSALYAGYYNHQSAVESQNLAAAIRDVAARSGCVFVDAAIAAEPGEDGIHMRESSQEPFAALLHATIKALVADGMNA